MANNKERENVRFEIISIYISHTESENMGNQKMKVREKCSPMGSGPIRRVESASGMVGYLRGKNGE